MKLTWLFLCLSLCLPVAALAQPDSLPASFRMPAHPRILWPAAEEAIILKNISTPGPWKDVHNTIISTSEKLLAQPVLERQMTGRRLLSISRECLRRVFFLSYAWRTEKDPRFADRAVLEMMAVSGFTDWNPSHFLDVAEMTMGMAIGYDWLYDRLTPGQRRIISAAIIEKACSHPWKRKTADG